MGLPQSPNPPRLYTQELQLKLYQAFIFSIPILFSIILFLLFYLFYLKKRASSFSPPPPTLPTTSDQATLFTVSVCEEGLKGDLKDKLHKIMFDEKLRARDSVCCVCLGEFETKEELLQVPSCKHVFHVECIRHWLRSNTTCPLCRCSVVEQNTTNYSNNNYQQIVHLEVQQQIREQVPSSSSSSSSSSSTTSVGGLSSSSGTVVVMHVQVQ